MKNFHSIHESRRLTALVALFCACPIAVFLSACSVSGELRNDVAADGTGNSARAIAFGDECPVSWRDLRSAVIPPTIPSTVKNARGAFNFPLVILPLKLAPDARDRVSGAESDSTFTGWEVESVSDGTWCLQIEEVRGQMRIMEQAVQLKAGAKIRVVLSVQPRVLGEEGSVCARLFQLNEKTSVLLGKRTTISHLLPTTPIKIGWDNSWFHFGPTPEYRVLDLAVWSWNGDGSSEVAHHLVSEAIEGSMRKDDGSVALPARLRDWKSPVLAVRCCFMSAE